MEKHIDIFIDRVKSGRITVNDDQTIGQIIIDILTKYKEKISIGSEPVKIVNNPPNHSDISILFVGPRNRYLKCFNLSSIRDYRSLKFDSAINRYGKLINDEKHSIIPDIAYNNSISIYVFNDLSDWMNTLINLEKLHLNALICHHNYLHTKDQRHRQENQKIRRQISDKTTSLLRFKQSNQALGKLDSKTNDGSIQLSYSDYSNVCHPLVSGPTIKDKNIYSGSSYSGPSNMKPRISSNSEIRIDANNKPLKDSYIDDSSIGSTSSSSSSSTRLINNDDKYIPFCHYQQYGPIMNSLINPKNMISVSDNSEESTSSLDIVYTMNDNNTNSSIEEDYKVALALHNSINGANPN